MTLLLSASFGQLLSDDYLLINGILGWENFTSALGFYFLKAEFRGFVNRPVLFSELIKNFLSLLQVFTNLTKYLVTK